MSNEKMKPTDTNKLLEWLEGFTKDLHDTAESLHSKNEATEKELRLVAEFQLGAMLIQKIKAGAFVHVETTKEPQFELTLKEIWEKHVGYLSDANVVGDAEFKDVHHCCVDTCNMWSLTSRNKAAIVLAMAVHMEFEGTPGYFDNWRYVRFYLWPDNDGNLSVKNGFTSGSGYLLFTTKQNAERAAELLQPYAKQLFLDYGEHKK